jgi:hypothetical protein
VSEPLIPERFRKPCDALPPALRALLEAELAAGNRIEEVTHSHPAPPAGACIRLAAAVSTRPRAAGGGLRFRDVSGSLYSGEFSDDRGFYFIVEPPLPPPPEPDMDAIRAARDAGEWRPSEPPAAGAVERFRRSMQIGYEQWHDGVGYDLEALRAASPKERKGIEDLLVAGGVRDWRDAEALAALDTPRARQALLRALDGGDAALSVAIAGYAPDLVGERRRAAVLAHAIETAVLYGGLSEALDEAASFHPPEVVDALFRAALAREGEVAVHCAAVLAFVHGKAAEPFDMELRPFFLRFHTGDPAERRRAFDDLIALIGGRPRP